MNRKKTSSISLLVVLLLVGSIFYPLALTYPYTETAESYAVVHESTEEFNHTIEEYNISISNPTPVTDLSPNAQRTVRQAKDGDSRHRSGGGLIDSDSSRFGDEPAVSPNDEDGWQRAGGVLICSDSLLFCDKPTEAPEFPVDGGIAGDIAVDFGVIEDDGDVYLVQTVHPFTLLADDAVYGLIETLVKFLLFGSYAAFLSSVTWSYRETHPETVFSFAAYGVGLLAISYSVPYAVMLYPFSPKHVLILYIAAVVLLLYEVRNTKHELARSDDG